MGMIYPGDLTDLAVDIGWHGKGITGHTFEHGGRTPRWMIPCRLDIDPGTGAVAVIGM